MKKKFLFLAKIAVGAGLIFWLIEKVNWTVVLEELREVSPVFILLYIVLQLSGNLISARKWQVIAEHKHRELHFTLKQGFFTYLTGAFINNFLPSTIGGDAYRGLWLAKKTDAKAASISTVVFDRFIGLWTTAILALLFSFPLWRYFSSDVAVQATLLSLIAFLLVDLFITYAYFQTWFHHFVTFLPFKIRRLIEEVIGFTKKGIWTKGSLYSALFAFVGIALSNYALFSALGKNIDFLPYLSVIFIVTIISSVPLSINNIGIKEWAYFTFFPLIGVAPESAVTVAILSRFIQMIISFIALPQYLREGSTKKD
ncbi:MAG: hypothetical protein QG581_408 [Patescibacteria group bacterium]|nr:hypothetical protein [Patescibacteria group bacterium]